MVRKTYPALVPEVLNALRDTKRSVEATRAVLEQLEETLEVLADRQMMATLHSSQRDERAGRVRPLAEVKRRLEER